jgi:hypothetical protein
MGLLKLSKELFAVKEPPSSQPEKKEEIKEQISFQEYGLHQASMLGGSIPGLRVCLQKVYYNFKERIKDDLDKQDELKKPARIKVEEHKGDIDRWENKIKRIQDEDIPRLNKK